MVKFSNKVEMIAKTEMKGRTRQNMATMAGS